MRMHTVKEDFATHLGYRVKRAAHIENALGVARYALRHDDTRTALLANFVNMRAGATNDDRRILRDNKAAHMDHGRRGSSRSRGGLGLLRRRGNDGPRRGLRVAVRVGRHDMLAARAGRVGVIRLGARVRALMRLLEIAALGGRAGALAGLPARCLR